MKIIKTAVFAVLALAATLAFPLGVINFIAADNSPMLVTVYNSGIAHKKLTNATTVSDFMHEIGLTLNNNERMNHTPDSPIIDGMNISIERRITFTVQIDNKTVLTRTTWPNATVEMVLVTLQRETNTPLIYGGNYERRIIDGEILSFMSWRSRIQTDILIVPYQTHENHTASVWQGRTHVRQIGSLGEHEVTTEVIYIGGIEQNREIISKYVLATAVDAIVDIGTAQLGALADVTAPDFHYIRRVRMEATAYTAGYSCTGRRPGDRWYRITASGREVEHGIVAVDRTVIPLGTRLYVEGYGFAIAADVGGAIRGYKIDLFMEDLADARRFGRRHLYVWILDEI